LVCLTFIAGATVAETPDLQFDRAQFDGGATQPGCAVCHTPLHGSYFEVNGHTVCEACCYKLRDAEPTGSRAGRGLRAIAAGVGAGLAGAILYWLILALSGYEFSLIAILVGYGVGKGVRWGSGGRGGRAYQALAIALTYLAIVSAYVPLMVTEILKQKPAAQAQTAASEGTVVPAAASNETSEAQPSAEKGTRGSIGGLLIGFGLLLLVACAAPFLAGFQNIIGLVIIGIGMYQAWKINRRVPLVISGPHALAASPTATAG
jgi:hypothetical protein